MGNIIRCALWLPLAISLQGCASHSFYSDALLFERSCDGKSCPADSPASTNATPSSSAGVGWNCVEPRSPSAPRFKPAEDSQLFPYGNNPVQIASDGKFSLSIESVFVGSIEDNGDGKLDAFGAAFSRGRSPIELHHHHDKQLWMLSTVTSLEPGDPLEANSKRYFRATNIKRQSGPQEMVPLDMAERRVFTHTADSSYRVRLQLFEVDDLGFKRVVQGVASDPGIEGVLKVGYQTVSGLVRGLGGNLAGDLLEKLGSEENETQKLDEGPSRFERLLLTAGAAEIFRGEILLVRDRRDFATLHATQKPEVRTRDLMLADVLNGTVLPSTAVASTRQLLTATYADRLRDGQLEISPADYCPLPQRRATLTAGTGQVTPSDSLPPPNGSFLLLQLSESQNAPALATNYDPEKTLAGIQTNLNSTKDGFDKFGVEQAEKACAEMAEIDDCKQLAKANPSKKKAADGDQLKAASINAQVAQEAAVKAKRDLQLLEEKLSSWVVPATTDQPAISILDLATELDRLKQDSLTQDAATKLAGLKNQADASPMPEDLTASAWLSKLASLQSAVAQKNAESITAETVVNKIVEQQQRAKDDLDRLVKNIRSTADKVAADYKTATRSQLKKLEAHLLLPED